MNSLLAARQGSRTPRIKHVPPGTVGSAGRDVVELAASVGLHLLDWQCDVLDDALAERLDHNWVAGEVGLNVARQNGKGGVLEALEIAGLFLFGMRQIIHSAHEYKTAVVHHRRLEALLRPSWLHEYIGDDGYPKGGGSRAIVLKTGARLDISARTRGAARGFTGDLVVFDEAYNLSDDAMGAMVPTLLTNPEAQVWYTSSAPHADSEVFHSIRNRALEGDEPRLVYFEWGNEPGADALDWEARAAANPSLGTLITEEAIDDLYRRLHQLPGQFERECLGIPDMPDGGASIFGPGKWQACQDPDSQVGPEQLALDVGPGGAWASFAIAGRRADGKLHVELIERSEGTGWVVEKARALQAAGRGKLWLLPSPHPVSGIVDTLRKARINLEETPVGMFPKACAAFQNLVINGGLRHLGQAPLDAAVNGAAVRTVGEGWTWTRQGLTDISPLVAATVALWAAMQLVSSPATATNPDVETPGESMFARSGPLDL